MFGRIWSSFFKCSTLNRLLRTAVAYRGGPESSRGWVVTFASHPASNGFGAASTPAATCSDLPHAQNSRCRLPSPRAQSPVITHLSLVSNPYGRGPGVGRGLAVGVGRAAGVEVGVGVGVGPPWPQSGNLKEPMRVCQLLRGGSPSVWLG
jgi:hypothetical protein